jgi:uncharacterized protein YjbI with pentapeptide repeats
MAYIVIISVIIISIVIWIIPKIQIRNLSSMEDQVKKYEVENELRKTIVQIAGGFTLILSLIFTWHQLAQTKNKDFSEQLNKIIVLMGNDQQYVKIGAIYSMEHLSVNNKDSIPLVTDILSSFLRGNYKWVGKKKLPEFTSEVTNATLVVINKNLRKWVGLTVNLSETDLRKSELHDHSYQSSVFVNTHFEESDLDGTSFDNSNMIGSVFDGANLSNCSFVGANLSNASFRGAIFNNTDFSASNLSNAKGLEKSQIQSNELIVSDKTILPKDLK